MYLVVIQHELAEQRFILQKRNKAERLNPFAQNDGPQSAQRSFRQDIGNQKRRRIFCIARPRRMTLRPRAICVRQRVPCHKPHDALFVVQQNGSVLHAEHLDERIERGLKNDP